MKGVAARRREPLRMPSGTGRARTTPLSIPSGQTHGRAYVRPMPLPQTHQLYQLLSGNLADWTIQQTKQRKGPAVSDRGPSRATRRPRISRPRLLAATANFEVPTAAPRKKSGPPAVGVFHGTRHSPTNPRPAPCISSPAGKGCSLYRSARVVPRARKKGPAPAAGRGAPHRTGRRQPPINRL
jgi:hypothetical protein